MELAALVSSINPTLTQTTDVHEIAQMQHRLLWLLYDSGKYDTVFNTTLFYKKKKNRRNTKLCFPNGTLL